MEYPNITVKQSVNPFLRLIEVSEEQRTRSRAARTYIHVLGGRSVGMLLWYACRTIGRATHKWGGRVGAAMNDL